ncbi:MAG TPA: long-chain fatty acid--CoA ligase [Paracoccaceae bacterium]|nr:long-chain fatty acid--CoA ligase [Paracoccaceae bacterium]
MRHHDWLHHHARATPGRPCWTDLHSGRRFTFAEAERRVRRLADHLQNACGVEKGDRVAVLAMNSTDVMEVHSACAKLGAICLLMNWRLAAPELDFIMSDAEPKALIHDVSTRELVAAMTERALHEIETTGAGEPSPYEDAIAASNGDVRICEGLTLDDPWTIMYTSGTTGRPKGAPQTYGMTLINTINAGPSIGLTSASVGLTLLPLFHTGGLNTWTTPLLHHGGHSLIMRSFDPGRALELISDPEVGITHFLCVPANYLFMSQHPDFETSDWSRVVSANVGGAPTPKPLLELYAARKGISIRQGFGMTETSPAVSIQDPETALEKPGSAGRPVLHGELKIVREDGTEAETDEVGELWVKGPNITPGYWKRPDANAKEWVDGWFRTGDAARLDGDGDLWIVDRWKDMYISGGENVYPAEVESAIFALEGVADAAVIGEPDERWGEVGVACVVRAEGAAITEEDVIAHCQGRLARYKIPKRVAFLDVLPRNATGKVLKRELRGAV